MMTRNHLYMYLAVFALTGYTQGLASDFPKKQPNLIHIYRESVKTGRAAEHAVHEKGYVAAFEKAKGAQNYLALASETGPDEVWYITPYESNAQLGERTKQMLKDPGLMSELDRLDRNDAEYLHGITKILATARPDLLIGEYPDIAKARFFEITTYRIRPGYDDLFEAAAKAYKAAAQRAKVDVNARVFQVISGMTGPTILIFSTLENYAQFDQMAPNWGKVWEAANPEERNTMVKFMKEALLEETTNRYRVDPTQSFVPKETRDSDPEFWNQK